MPYRRLAAALFVALLFLAAAPKTKKRAPVPARAARSIAPDQVPHAQAMFLASLSHDGRDQVQFRAAAYGKRFFLEEPNGVTVYVYDAGDYRRETFLPKATLASAMKKYPDQMKP
jgi:hypothetical protein